MSSSQVHCLCYSHSFNHKNIWNICLEKNKFYSRYRDILLSFKIILFFSRGLIRNREAGKSGKVPNSNTFYWREVCRYPGKPTILAKIRPFCTVKKGLDVWYVFSTEN